MTTPRYALMGDPIGGSPSPAMHNRAFAALQIDARYELRPTPAAGVLGAVREVLDGTWQGANVTTPLKTLVAAHVPLGGAAARAGAVNTLWRDGKTVVGALTDVEGVVVPLREHGYGGGGRGLIIGAGGAARAAVLALDELQTEVNVLARRPAVARALLAQLRPNRPGAVFAPDETADLEALFAEVAVVIQATPVGREGDHHVLPWSRVAGPVRVLEMLYRPRRTPFLCEAEAAGCDGIEGWEMLLAQGEAAFSLWTGRTAPRDAMRHALLEALGA